MRNDYRSREIVGKKFGKLLVISQEKNSLHRCKCDCGNELVEHKSNLLKLSKLEIEN